MGVSAAWKDERLSTTTDVRESLLDVPEFAVRSVFLGEVGPQQRQLYLHKLEPAGGGSAASCP